MRQTSWLYTKRSKGIESGQMKTNPVCNRVEGLNLRPPDYKPQRPDYSVTLPPEVITLRIRIIANTPANDFYTICFTIFYFFFQEQNTDRVYTLPGTPVTLFITLGMVMLAATCILPESW